MDMHGPLDHRVRLVSIHHIEDGVNRLIPSCAENRRPHDPLRVRIN